MIGARIPLLWLATFALMAFAHIEWEWSFGVFASAGFLSGRWTR